MCLDDMLQRCLQHFNTQGCAELLRCDLSWLRSCLAVPSRQQHMSKAYLAALGMAWQRMQWAGWGAADLKDDGAAAGDTRSGCPKCAGASQARQDAGHRDPLAPLEGFQQPPNLQAHAPDLSPQTCGQASKYLQACGLPNAPWTESASGSGLASSPHKHDCQLPCCCSCNCG